MRNSGFIAPPAPAADTLFGEAVLWAGDIVVETGPVRMNTILGSCVSVCLFDTVHGFGGMNHHLVPRGGKVPIHGDWAVARLIALMHEHGASNRGLQAKVFGGGSPLRLANEDYAVGPENVIVAREVLAAHGIPIVAERVHHNGGLRIYFENWTGTVWLRRPDTGNNHE